MKEVLVRLTCDICESSIEFETDSTGEIHKKLDGIMRLSKKNPMNLDLCSDCMEVVVEKDMIAIIPVKDEHITFFQSDHLKHGISDRKIHECRSETDEVLFISREAHNEISDQEIPDEICMVFVSEDNANGLKALIKSRQERADGGLH